LTSVLKPELIDRDSPRSSRAQTEQKKIEVTESSFDRLLSGRYYNSATKMNSNYLDYYGPLLLMFILSCGLAGVLVLASAIIGRHKRSREKDQPYECGMRPTGDARQPISVQFYMVGLLFILFDIEAIFLYPWALIYSDLKVFGFVEMLLYIIILLAGYIFLWKKGALDWTH
jgi:NADH-quinone oxidoreductase subunit A